MPSRINGEGPVRKPESLTHTELMDAALEIDTPTSNRSTTSLHRRTPSQVTSPCSIDSSSHPPPPPGSAVRRSSPRASPKVIATRTTMPPSIASTTGTFEHPQFALASTPSHLGKWSRVHKVSPYQSGHKPLRLFANHHSSRTGSNRGGNSKLTSRLVLAGMLLIIVSFLTTVMINIWFMRNYEIGPPFRRVEREAPPSLTHLSISPDKLYVETGNYTRGGTTMTNDVAHPRVVSLFVGGLATLKRPEMVPDPMLSVTPGEEAAPQDHPRVAYEQGTCVPIAPWQTQSFPNCNSIHELDLRAGGVHSHAESDETHTRRQLPGLHPKDDDSTEPDKTTLLGMGWFRQAWKVDRPGTSEDSMVLKTLRLERDFFDEYYDLHRRDAMAMERLTHSQYVLDIYGYCGQSALNELAHFAGGMSSLEDLAKSLKNNYKSEVNSYRLQVAAMIALGLAHVHEIDGRDRASLVHYDMNPRNIAIVKSGKPKLNDFNVAEFLRWDTALNQSCGFAGRLHEPWWRAPEEMIIPGEQGALDAPRLNEKVDVYAFGNILQKFLTGHMPRGRIEKDRAVLIRAQVLEGHPPPMSSFFRKSKDPAIVAMRDAIALCLKPDPNERGSSREVATILMKGVKKLKAKGLV